MRQPAPPCRQANPPTLAHPPVPLASPSLPRPGCGWLGCGLVALLPLALIIGLVAGVFIAVWLSEPLNVLVLGLDRRPGETAARSDTLLLARFDPHWPRAALLSIPRDLWVDIPNHGPNRINTANYFGDLAQPGSGPFLAMETVQQNFGPTIQGYVVVDFAGFVALVDALGGLEIDVPQTIVDSHYPTTDYGTTTITIPAGRQFMDGQTVLIYARTRHADSDFNRGQRQQQVLQALAVRVLQPTAWPRLPVAWVVARTYFPTNLSLIDWATIFLALLRVGPEGVQSLAIDQEMTTPFVTEAGAQVLLPRWEVILPLVQGVFQ